MARGRRGKRTKEMINIAGERIDILFDLAEEEARAHNLPRANRYVELARKIGMRYNVRISRRYRRRYCKHCHAYLLPSVSCRVRVMTAWAFPSLLSVITYSAVCFGSITCLLASGKSRPVRLYVTAPSDADDKEEAKQVLEGLHAVHAPLDIHGPFRG